MADDLEIVAFSSVEQLWSWLEEHHAAHPGAWVQLQKAGSAVASIGFHDLLETGIAYERNLALADRLEAEGRMTPAGHQALGRR